jgi:hypothetical protein
MATIERFVMVTTDSRGVFAGVLVEQTKTTVRLKDARMCVYWSSYVRGVIGLTAQGPSASCRITPAAPMAHLKGVTGVFDCTQEARAKWEAEPWG